MAGQTISDRILAARHSIAGQGLAKSVCKSTTEEILGPKKKHLEYLLHCTNEPNVSIPQMANLLIERSQSTSWVAVFKALITTHHLMCYGNERFTQYLASSNCSFQLSNYTDKSGGPQATGGQGYDMSPYIRRYSIYLNEKAFSYRGVAFDFCKVKRGKEDGTLRTMPTDKLLKSLPILQTQLDALLAFDATANDLTNSVINTAFMYLFRDLIRLFACYNDGIINLLEKFFEMNKKQCKDALDCYKKFLIRMDRVAEFLKVAETVGLDKSEIPDLKKYAGIDRSKVPDLRKAPSSLLDALEAHLANLEGRKPGKEGLPTPAPTQASRSTLSTAIGTFDTTGSSFGQAATSSNLARDFLSANGDQIDENIKKQVLAEEEAAIEKFKKSTNPFLSSPTSSSPSSSANPPAPAPAMTSSAILDLFSMEEPTPAAPAGSMSQVQASNRSLDDLLGINANPFSTTQQAPPIPPMPGANSMNWNAISASPAPSPFMSAQMNMMGAPMMHSNGFGMQHTSTSSNFATESSFSSVFGASNGKPVNASVGSGELSQSETGKLDMFDDLLCDFGLGAAKLSSLEGSGSLGGSPARMGSNPSSEAMIQGSPARSTGSGGFDAFGDVMQPQAQQAGYGGAPKPAAQQKVITGDLDSSLASLALNLNINKTGQAQMRPNTGSASGQGMRPMQPMGGMMGSMPQTGWQGQQPGMVRPQMGMVPGAAAPMMRPSMVPMMQPMVGSVAPMMGQTVPMSGMSQSGHFTMTGSQSQSLDPFGAL